jgi:hypothetical protein
MKLCAEQCWLLVQSLIVTHRPEHNSTEFPLVVSAKMLCALDCRWAKMLTALA